VETYDEHNDALVELGHLHATTRDAETLHDVLHDISEVAARQTSHHCSIAVRAGSGGAYVVAGSDRLSVELDELQIAAGAGPSLDAVRDGVVVTANDLMTEGRWRGYGAQAAGRGAASSLSYPITRGSETLGVLTIYSIDPLASASSWQRVVAGVASREARAVELAVRLAGQAELIGNLEAAFASRSTIDQAVGVLMAEQRCDSRRAFELLRSASQRRNVKLRVVAQGIVERFGSGHRDPVA
jgi:GAF domain-containing protein